MTRWWEHALVYLGIFIFVLLWVVKNIDYDNLIKWRGMMRKNGGNWQWWALLLFLILVGEAAYSVYWSIIHISN